MRSPERQAKARAFFDYAIGVTTARPQIDHGLERELGKFGVVDPAGFTLNKTDELGAARVEPGMRRGKKSQEEPASLREYRLRNSSGMNRLYQPLTHIEGKPVTLNASSGRGHIEMVLDEAGKPVKFAVEVLAGDRSTFAHETAHFLSWSLHDVAQSDLATPELRADYENLIKWAGYADAGERVKASQERQQLERIEHRTDAEEKRFKELTAKEERISHGWEQYLLEGKTPSERLARVFSRFRDWMLRIYRGVQGIQATYRAQYGEEIGLSDQVRQIFDRMLAEDQALTEALTEVGRDELPSADVMKGMDGAERAEYLKARQEDRFASSEELRQRAAEIENQRVKAEETRVRGEVTRELDKQPVYRATRYLQSGELVDENGAPLKEVPATMLDEKGKPFKLNRQSFVEKHGAAARRLMPPGVFATGKGGVPVEQLAPLLGFDDGEQLVEKFLQADERGRAIDKAVKEHLDRTYGPAFAAISEAAMSAVHQPESARVTLLELRALAKQINPEIGRRVNAVDLSLKKSEAERMVGEMNVGSLDPATFARVERQTQLKAQRLIGAGEHEQAFAEKEAALLNQLLWRAARDAKDELEKARAKMEGTSEDVRAKLGLVDPSYRDVHDQLLAAVGLAAPLPEGRSLDELLKVADANAQDVVFDVDLIRKLLQQPKPWDALSVDEAHAVADASTNIKHLGIGGHQLLLAGRQLERQQFVKELAERVKSVRPPQPPGPYHRDTEGFGDKARRLKRGGLAILEDVETWAEMLDGDAKGPAHDLLIKSRIEARTKDVELTKAVLEKIRVAWEKMPKDIRKLRDKRVDVAELLPPPAGSNLLPQYSRSMLWSLFLNWGNEGNRQRIRDGNGWTDENVQKALDMLTPEEGKFLQGVLDTIEGLYPEVAAVHEGRTGLTLGKVDAAPITIRGVEHRGGYFPLRYDSRFGARAAEMQEGDVVKSIFAPNYVRPTTPKSHTKERLDKVNASVDLSWGVVPAHLAQVVRDLAYGDWVRQTGGVLMDKEFRGVVDTFLGNERRKELVPWLRDVANARVDSSAGHTSDFLRTIGPAARNKVALAVMGLNLPSLARHLFDPWTSLADSESVHPGRILQSYLKILNPQNWNDPLFDQSTEIAFHESKMTDNLRLELERIGPRGGGVSRAISETIFKAHGFVDHFTTRVAFRAAFLDAKGRGASDAQAVERADEVLGRHFPSGDIAEKPPILRTKYGIASALMFYGYASKMHNLRARAFDAAFRAWNKPGATASDKGSAIATVAAKWLALGAVASVGGFFAGRGWRRDEENPAVWAGLEMVLSPIEDLPIIGPSFKRAVTGHEPNVASAPELAMLEQWLTKIQRLVDKAEGGGAAKEATVWDAIAAVPLGQLDRTAGYIGQLQSGEARPRGPLDVGSGLLYGEKKKPVATPLTAVQGVISGR